jgi:hypothetical protein
VGEIGGQSRLAVHGEGVTLFGPGFAAAGCQRNTDGEGAAHQNPTTAAYRNLRPGTLI